MIYRINFSFTGALIISYLFVIWHKVAKLETDLVKFWNTIINYWTFSFMIGFIAQIINQNFSNIRKIKKKIEYFDNHKKNYLVIYWLIEIIENTSFKIYAYIFQKKNSN